MGSGRYLIIDSGDSKYAPYVIEEIEERDVIQAKKEWQDEPNIVIARIIWESESEVTPVTYTTPEGECLDGYLK